MNIKLKNSRVQRFQMGGPMQQEAPVEEPMQTGEAPVQEQAPEQGEQQDPMMMLAQMSAQALQNQDCQMAMQVCQAFLEILQQMQGGAPEQSQGEPVFAKNGAKLRVVRRIK